MQVQKIYIFKASFFFFFVIVVQSFSRVRLFATSWTAASQASLSFTISRSLVKLMSIESVMSFNHLILYCPLLLLTSVFPRIIPVSSWPQSFPASGSFPMSRLFASDGQSIGASASASVPSVNIQDWFPLEWTGLLLQSEEFSNNTFQKHQFFSAQPSLRSNSHIHTGLLENFI